DWSSAVCSSDLAAAEDLGQATAAQAGPVGRVGRSGVVKFGGLARCGHSCSLTNLEALGELTAHDVLAGGQHEDQGGDGHQDGERSEEHTSELQSRFD